LQINQFENIEGLNHQEWIDPQFLMSQRFLQNRMSPQFLTIL